MKKIKLVIMLLILALVLVFAYQNQAYFQGKQQFGMALPLMDPYTTPEVSTVVVCLICFFLGVLFSFTMSISGRVKRKRTIKALNVSVKKRDKEIETLKKEVKENKEVVPTPEPAELTETTDSPSPDPDKQETPSNQ